MTSDGKLTKDELQSTSVSVERDTSGVYLTVTVTVDGTEYSVEQPLAAPTAREHGPIITSLAPLWDRLADQIESQEPESSDEPQAL
jgi:hypothetical protein